MMWQENGEEFGVRVQQLTYQELEQLHTELTDSNQLRLVELELQRHEMVRAEEARNSSSHPQHDVAVETASAPGNPLPEKRFPELDRQMSELVATRRSLALSAAEGDKKAATKLDEIEKQIASVEINRERAKLAEEESHRRAAEDKRRKEEQGRQEREAQLCKLSGERLGIDERVQSHVEALVGHVNELLAIGDEMENLAQSIGLQGHYLRPRDNVVCYLNTSLAPLLPHDFPYPHSSRRGALVESEGSLLSDFISPKGK